MAANRIKGIAIENRVDTTKLQTTLKGVNTEVKNTQQLKDVKKLLKLDQGNTELLAQKHKLLGEAAEVMNYMATKKMVVKSVLWHSTGTNNLTIRRYVQPDDNASDRDAMIKLIGKNAYENDWNHSSVQAGLNDWIGMLADARLQQCFVIRWDEQCGLSVLCEGDGEGSEDTERCRC